MLLLGKKSLDPLECVDKKKLNEIDSKGSKTRPKSAKIVIGKKRAI